MGIVNGKARVKDDFRDLQGLSEAGLGQLWVAFNELADGYALDADLWAAILWDARRVLTINVNDMSKDKFEQWCRDCFNVVDTDENGLIDALEALGIICAISSASNMAKLQFAFTLYDFDTREALALDELALLLRTTCTGLVKICSDANIRKPAESIIERIAQNAFKFENINSSARIPREAYEKYFISACLEVESWLAFFNPAIGNGMVASERPSSSLSQTKPQEARGVEQTKLTKKQIAKRRPRYWETHIVDLEPSESMSLRHDESLPAPVDVNLEHALGFNQGVGIVFVAQEDTPVLHHLKQSVENSTHIGDQSETPEVSQRSVFACGNIVVVSSIDEPSNSTLKQTFYQGHSSLVTAIASNNLNLVASAGKNELHVWNSTNCELKVKLAISGLMKAPSHIQFAAKNQLIACGAAIAPASGFNIAIFQYETSPVHVFSESLPDVVRVSGIASATPHLFGLSCIGLGTPIVFECIANISWHKQNAIATGDLGSIVLRRSSNLTAITSLVPDYIGSDENVQKISCFYTGSTSGDLVEWVGRTVNRHIISAHNSEITALTSAGKNQRVVSCSADGVLKVWSHDFTSAIHELSLQRCVLNLCFSQTSSSILAELEHKSDISRKSSDSRRVLTDLVNLDLQVDSPSAEVHMKTIMPSFSFGIVQVLGTNSEICCLRAGGLFRGPAGSSGSLVPLRPALKDQTKLTSGFDVTKCGKLLAIAQPGAVLLYAYREKKGDAGLVATLSDFREHWPASIKFSPDSQTLIVVLEGDGTAYVYDVGELRIQLERANLAAKNQNFSDLLLCRGKVSPDNVSLVTSVNIDFTEDTRFARIGYTGLNVTSYIDVRAASPVADIAQLKDQFWSSATCTYGWGVHGAWADIEGKHDVCAACVLRPPSVTNSKTGPLLCAGIHTGEIEIRRWPCMTRKRAKKMTTSIKAHSQPITQLIALPQVKRDVEEAVAQSELSSASFASYDSNAGSLLFWNAQPQISGKKTFLVNENEGKLASLEHGKEEGKGEEDTVEGEENEGEFLGDVDRFGEDPSSYLWRGLLELGELIPPKKGGKDSKAKSKKKKVRKAKDVTSRQITNKEAPIWFRELEEQPTLGGADFKRIPPTTLSLEKVHGISHGLKTIVSVKNNRTGCYDIIYSAGEILVLLSPEHGNEQLLNLGSRITCIASSSATSDRPLVAAGTISGDVLIVDVENFDIILHLTDVSPEQGAIWAVALSPCGEYLTACAGESRREILLWLLKNTINGEQARLVLPSIVSTVIGLEFRRSRSRVCFVYGEGFIATLQIDRNTLKLHSLLSLPDSAITCVSELLDESSVIFGDSAGTMHFCRLQENDLSEHSSNAKAHAKAITDISIVQLTGEIVTVGADGFLKRWPAPESNAEFLNFTPGLKVDAAALTSCLKNTPLIYCVALAPFGLANKKARAIISLSIGQILQIDLESGTTMGSGPLTQGLGAPSGGSHTSLGCAANHPQNSQIMCIVGSDRWLTLFDNKSCTRTPIDGAARSVSWRSDGKHLAVGMTGNFVLIYALNEKMELSKVFEQGDLGGGGEKSKKAGVVQVRFSQDSRVFGYIAGSKIYIVLIDEKSGKYEPFAELGEGETPLLSFEFTQNSKCVRAIDTNGGLHEMDIRAQAAMREKNKRKAEWAERTVPAGADLRALWLADETTVVTRMQAFHQNSEAYVVLGTSPHVLYSAHLPLPGPNPIGTFPSFPAGPPGSALTCVSVSPAAQRVVSIDDITGTVRTWRMELPQQAAGLEIDLSPAALATEESAKERYPNQKQQHPKSSIDGHAIVEIENKENDDTNLEELIAMQFAVSSDWLDAHLHQSSSTPTSAKDSYAIAREDIVGASNALRPSPTHERGQMSGSPQSKMLIEHVFGRSSICGGPFFTREGHLVTAAARFGLRTSTLGVRQQLHIHVPMHQTSSLCKTTALALCARAGIAAAAATTDSESESLIRIWHTGTCSSSSVQLVKAKGQILSLAFDQDGFRLASVFLSDQGLFKLQIFRAHANAGAQAEWKDSKRETIELSTAMHLINASNVPVWCSFIGKRSVAVGGESFLFVIRDIRKRESGGMVHYIVPARPEGAQETHQAEVAFTCGAGLASPESGIVATNCGSLLGFSHGKRSRTLSKACEVGAYIRSASSCPKSGCFVTGDSRGMVRVISPALEPMTTLNHTLDLTTCGSLHETHNLITSVDVDADCTRIVAGLATGEIILASTHTGSVSLIEAPNSPGLSETQSWALAINPLVSKQVCVASDDGFVRVWDLETKEMLVWDRIEEDSVHAAIRAAAWSPDGLSIAIGYGREEHLSNRAKAGAFAILDASTLDIIFHGRDSKEWITDIKFSPNGSHLALASMDGCVYIYDARNGFKLSFVCEKLKQGAIAIDFANSSLFLRATTLSMEHVVFNASSGEQVADEEKTKDQVWLTSTCPTAWGFQGFAMSKASPSDFPELPSSNTRDVDLNLALCGDVQGNVHWSNFPYLSLPRGNEADRVKRQPAHAGPVMRLATVSINNDNSSKSKEKWALSLGSRDGALILWKVQSR